jgi:cysteine desulfurase
VLKAMGVADDMAATSIRFGLGRFNTEAEVDTVIERVAAAVARLREISPLYHAERGGTLGNDPAYHAAHKGA